MVRLDENEDESLEHGLEEDVEGYARAQKSSLICECGFGDVRRRERKAMNGKAAPQTVWWGFAHGSALPKEFDRPLPAPTGAAMAVAPSKLVSELFDFPESVPEDVCSLSPEMLDTMAEHPPSWPSPSSHHHKLASMRWLCASF